MATHRPDDHHRDLGFGSVLGSETGTRLLNPDGSFNVVREGLSPLSSLSVYHFLLTLSWPRFLALVAIGYLLANAVFAVGYMLCGHAGLSGIEGTGPLAHYMGAFFFSVHTLATIGYGTITPHGIAANLLVTAESLVGLLGFALATGVVFARFARPVAFVLFSRRAVIAPYHGGTAFMFRIVNGRSNQLIEVGAQLSVNLTLDGARGFHELPLERERVSLFPLSWTVVHPIDPTSPLWGLAAEGIAASDAEFYVVLTGTDETFAQQVHARRSYRPAEIVWGARFTDVFVRRPNRPIAIDVRRLHDVEPAELPPPTTAPITVVHRDTPPGAFD